MPIVKSIPIRATVERSLAYILNPDKTEDLLYTTSLNCMTNAKDAYLNMKLVYEQFSGKKFNEPIPEKAKARVKAIHYIQSFSPDENITPQKAHDIAKAFALKAFGNEAQFVISTHCDKNHLHSHIIINTYSLTGKKFNDNKTSRQNIRNISDGVCLAFGIQPIKQGQGTSRIASYTEWDNKRKGTSWKEKIRQEIDRLIPDVKNLDELLYKLEIRGYEVKKGKYISVKAPDQKRFVRTKTLGEGYTAASLASRLLWSKVGIDVNTVDIKPSEIRDKYQFVLGQVIQFSRDNKKVQRKNNNAEPYSPQNDRDVYILSAQLSIINRDRIRSIVELESRLDTLKSEIEQARQEINNMTTRFNTLLSISQQTEMYFELADKKNLSDSEKVKLQICQQTMKNNNISDRKGLEYLNKQIRQFQHDIDILKARFNKSQQLYDVYTDIANTYYDISKSDYISHLVEEKRKEIEEQKNTKKKKYSL